MSSISPLSGSSPFENVYQQARRRVAEHRRVAVIISGLIVLGLQFETGFQLWTSQASLLLQHLILVLAMLAMLIGILFNPHVYARYIFYRALSQSGFSPEQVKRLKYFCGPDTLSGRELGIYHEHQQNSNNQPRVFELALRNGLLASRRQLLQVYLIIVFVGISYLI